MAKTKLKSGGSMTCPPGFFCLQNFFLYTEPYLLIEIDVYVKQPILVSLAFLAKKLIH